jgi:hypothetical protein
LPCPIRDIYQSDRVQFVGFTPTDSSVWQERLAYVNAGLGRELQGTLYLVIVQQEQINQYPDSYVQALEAHWMDVEEFGKDAMPKNGIVVILGTADGETVSWARAFTGMPVGNEHLAEGVRDMIRIPLSPQSILGSVRGTYYRAQGEKNEEEIDVRAVIDGALPKILWGVERPETRFQRVSMSAEDAGDIGPGFRYLIMEVEPTNLQKFWISFTAFVLSALLWGLAIGTTWYELEELEV